MNARKTLCALLSSSALLGVAAFGLAAFVQPAAAQEPAPVVQPTDIGPPTPPADDAGGMDSLLNMAEKDAGQLSQVSVGKNSQAPALSTEVSSVDRTPSTVGRSPAAVFVITNDMIRRSGAMTIPEVLRMAPGVNVARIDSNKWAVSVRGFNGQFANKLLVLIDGRSVYTPLFAGVIWDVQDVLLEDVERIEIIRGPGASVWGANAVNGVINIMTKKAKDTQGAFVQSGGGSQERGFTNMRYGGAAGDMNYRVYGKWFERGRTIEPGEFAEDDWRQGRGGFRMDWDPGKQGLDTLTLQGDYYDGYSGSENLLPSQSPPFVQQPTYDAHVSGANVIGRWSRTISDTAAWQFQMYYDRTERHFGPSFNGQNGQQFDYDRDTIDVDFQLRFQPALRHRIVTGMGYRWTRDWLTNSPNVFELNPAKFNINLLSGFLQDEIMLSEDLLYFTAGSKLLTNTFTGFEYQPTGRLLLTPDEYRSIWCSVSRAVRTPSRAEETATVTLLPVSTSPFPVFPQFTGARGLAAETLMAYECGYRAQPITEFAWDVALFYNQYDKLSGSNPGAPFFSGPGMILPLTTANNADAEAYGVEVGADFIMLDNWKIRAAYTYLSIFLHPGNDAEGQNPHNQFYLQSSWDLGNHVQLDMIGRYVDALQTLGVPSYLVGDIRLAWRPRPTFEAFVVGRSLFDSSHPEFARDQFIGTTTTDIPAEVFGGITLRW